METPLTRLSFEGSTPDDYTGFFISLEGGDWTGKSTQLELLAEALRQHLYPLPVWITCEPGATELGKRLRQELMHGQDLSKRTEALLYAADRSEHAQDCLWPAVKTGSVVVSDRYLDSSIAYQGVGRGLGVEQIRELSLWAAGGLLPDLTLVLDADPANLVSRRPKVGLDRIERAGMEFHQQVCQTFRQLVAEDHQLAAQAGKPARMYLINAEQSIGQVHEEIISTLVAQCNRLLKGYDASYQLYYQHPDPDAPSFLNPSRYLDDTIEHFETEGPITSTTRELSYDSSIGAMVFRSPSGELREYDLETCKRVALLQQLTEISAFPDPEAQLSLLHSFDDPISGMDFDTGQDQGAGESAVSALSARVRNKSTHRGGGLGPGRDGFPNLRVIQGEGGTDQVNNLDQEDKSARDATSEQDPAGLDGKEDPDWQSLTPRERRVLEATWKLLDHPDQPFPKL